MKGQGLEAAAWASSSSPMRRMIMVTASARVRVSSQFRAPDWSPPEDPGGDGKTLGDLGLQSGAETALNGDGGLQVVFLSVGRQSGDRQSRRQGRGQQQGEKSGVFFHVQHFLSVSKFPYYAGPPHLCQSGNTVSRRPGRPLP